MVPLGVGLFGRAGPRWWRLAGPLVALPVLLVLGLPPLGGQAAQASSGGVTMSPCPNGLAKPAQDSLLRVFACNDGPAAVRDEKTALADLQSLYTAETQLMGFPISDHQEPGEDGRIDVYLVTTGQTLTREGDPTNLATDPGCPCDGAAPWDAINGTVSSGYIVALRPESLAPGAAFNSVLAHEFFHVLQYRHNTTISCPSFWFLEASATWAEWWFAPSTADTMVYPDFSKFQAKPEVSLTDSVHRSPYQDWVWLLFMQQQAGVASIANAWKAMEGKTGCPALNAAVNLQVPFNPYFGDFAVENFDAQLPNLATNKNPAWPDNFGTNYPDWVAANNPAVPGRFPEIMPKLTPGKGIILSKKPYPYTAKETVNLPPLSAQYTKVSPVPPAARVIGQGGSVEFDFSGLAPSGNLWVTLLAADKQTSGYATHNGVWQRIDLTGGDNQAKICLNLDGTKKNKPLTSQFYVILANRSSGASAAPVTGSYAITQRTTCAAEVAGPLMLNTTVNTGHGYVTKQSATLNVDFVSADFFPGAYDWTWSSGVMPWSERYKETYPCTPGTETIKASGSGTISSTLDFLGGGPDFYENSYSFTPSFPGTLLEGERLPGTESGPCGNGPVNLSAAIGSGCPAGPTPGAFRGVYTSGDAGLNLTCSGTSKSYTVNISGTLTATDPIQCGLWTSNCSIGSATITRNKHY